MSSYKNRCQSSWLASRNFFGRGGGKSSEAQIYIVIASITNFSIVLGQNFRGTKFSRGGQTTRGHPLNFLWDKTSLDDKWAL